MRAVEDVSTGDDEGGEGTETRLVDFDETIEDTFAVAHARRRRTPGRRIRRETMAPRRPCLDPETVIALDLAFARDEVQAGRWTPRPASLPYVRTTTRTNLELSAVGNGAGTRRGGARDRSGAGLAPRREAYELLAESPEGQISNGRRDG